jgi:ribonuclease P/MRP protein subunit POP7
MSAISRVRSTLSHMQKRRTQSVFAESGKGNARGGNRVLAAALAGAERVGVDGDFVVVKGTGRCVEKVLGVAGFFQGNADKEGCWVRLGTGSEWVVDDVEVPEGLDGGEEEDIPESRVRHVSVLEVRIGLR